MNDGIEKEAQKKKFQGCGCSGMYVKRGPYCLYRGRYCDGDCYLNVDVEKWAKCGCPEQWMDDIRKYDGIPEDYVKGDHGSSQGVCEVCATVKAPAGPHARGKGCHFRVWEN